MTGKRKNSIPRDGCGGEHRADSERRRSDNIAGSNAEATEGGRNSESRWGDDSICGYCGSRKDGVDCKRCRANRAFACDCEARENGSNSESSGADDSIPSDGSSTESGIYCEWCRCKTKPESRRGEYWGDVESTWAKYCIPCNRSSREDWTHCKGCGRDYRLSSKGKCWECGGYGEWRWVYVERTTT